MRIWAKGALFGVCGLMCVLVAMGVTAASVFGQDASGQGKAAETLSREEGEHAVKAVKFGKLWDGNGKVWTNAIVIVDGERVREVTTDAKRIPAQGEGLGLRKYFGLPGWIDVNTHISLYTGESLGVPSMRQIEGNSPAGE